MSFFLDDGSRTRGTMVVPGFFTSVGDGLVVGSSHRIAYLDLRQVAHAVVSVECHLRAVGAFQCHTSCLLVEGFDTRRGGHQGRANWEDS